MGNLHNLAHISGELMGSSYNKFYHICIFRQESSQYILESFGSGLRHPDRIALVEVCAWPNELISNSNMAAY